MVEGNRPELCERNELHDSIVRIGCSVAANVNLAFYQNAVPIIRELTIGNAAAAELRDIEVHLSSEPAFISPGVWRISSIAAESDHHLRLVDIKLNHGFLAGLTAAGRAELTFRGHRQVNRSGSTRPVVCLDYEIRRYRQSPRSHARPQRLGCAKRVECLQ